MTNATLLMVCVVLFNHMGLAEAIEKAANYKFRIISCPKCGTFWLSLIALIVDGVSVVESIAIAFALAYAALWMELLLSIMAKIYERAYNKISEAESKRTEAED